MKDIESKRQELAGKLVEREVVCCVSHLIGSLASACANGGIEDLSHDDLLEICVKDDWENPGIEFIRSDADLDQLEEIANHFGDWENLVDELGYETYRETQEELGNDVDDIDDWLKAQDECRTEGESVTRALRRQIEDEATDWEWVGREFNLDPDTFEAYEHWIVSNWLARKLRDKGEMVSDDILGLTVWGRCTSGQAILLDGVICEIAAELWPEEWNVAA